MKYRLNPYEYNSNVNKFNMNNNINSNEKTGYLEITVNDAETGMPVHNSDIEVFKLTISGEFAEKGISELIERYATDISGEIPLIELPIIQWPEERYFAMLDTFGYYDVTIVNIPIFEDVKTTYNIELTRVKSPKHLREYIRTPTKTESFSPPVWFF